jgi:hypothetical protein
MQAAVCAAKEHGVLATCAAFDIPIATYERHRAPMSGPRPRRPSPPRRLTDAERQVVLEVLHEPRFVDLAPAEVFATLREEERYLCSVRAMHRILAENAELRERRDQLRHPADERSDLPERPLPPCGARRSRSDAGEAPRAARRGAAGPHETKESCEARCATAAGVALARSTPPLSAPRPRPRRREAGGRLAHNCAKRPLRKAASSS